MSTCLPGSFCVNTRVGMFTTLAIVIHEIPHEVGDFAILIRSGFSKQPVHLKLRIKFSELLDLEGLLPMFCSQRNYYEVR